MRGLVRCKRIFLTQDNAAGVEEDFEVLGALPEILPPLDSYILTPNSLVYFLGKRYRLVFILDYSPSTAVVVSMTTHCVFLVFIPLRAHFLGRGAKLRSSR